MGIAGSACVEEFHTAERSGVASQSLSGFGARVYRSSVEAGAEATVETCRLIGRGAAEAAVGGPRLEKNTAIPITIAIPNNTILGDKHITPGGHFDEKRTIRYVPL